MVWLNNIKAFIHQIASLFLRIYNIFSIFILHAGDYEIEIVN
ncbi:hypothetical protein B4121_0150 [Bacillus paralicheniformis]|uniref:Uncharacterized protein n=1 Tax=Bacillus paralicheniformis TaxID=1648923 RepID=A0A7Z0X1Y2_9BACI|nr:hypothetical protein B4121_0150 [Bacillus paralicheniformis]